MEYLEKSFQEKLQENGFNGLKFVKSKDNTSFLSDEKIVECVAYKPYGKYILKVYATKRNQENVDGDTVLIREIKTHHTDSLYDCQYRELEQIAVNECFYQLRTDNAFDYMMLSRLISDCDYFLGNGNRHLPHLYYGEVEQHLSEMRKLWNGFLDDEKPEWCSLEDIDKYEKEMKL